ncbi:metallophosphoesterase family protein [Labrys wisconsinensis]|uniref:3',5'-cyclic AMP phosphodiesterase CpdA n=1 Tax=Labrys wisconsinensis TaxID=425677 RepID=A0ABU0J026_9HYPH|nr:metallophosphoesterase [Labrys wisconsinensis]MDQ0467616.1 3',5'-cyclic AMP phosphodiesterase CpdA [Labrys wisconsinensis]
MDGSHDTPMLDEDGIDRRGFLECMTWAGTGVLWTLAGGLPQAMGLGKALAAEAATPFTFLQISDSHVGFDKPANPDARATLREAIARIKALPTKPAFMIHTGDISHLSKDQEFDDADQLIKEAGIPVFYVPGEHDLLDDQQGKAYLDRYGKGSRGAGWFSFDHQGVHYVGLVNVVNLKAGGLGNLGAEQLQWLENDVAGLASSTPIVVFAHIPLWTVYPDWGWGTADGAQALALLKRFGSVTVLNGHIHQVMQKVEGNVAFHTARSTAFPQPAPGTAPSPGPMKVPAGELASHLGIATVDFVRGDQPLAIVDRPLAG